MSKSAHVRLSDRQLDRLRRRMRHIQGKLEAGATSDGAAAHYRSELGALRQVVEAFEPPARGMMGTGEQTVCSPASLKWSQEWPTCTADEAEEDER